MLTKSRTLKQRRALRIWPSSDVEGCSALQGTAAQLHSATGDHFMLTEAADALPKWLDSSRAGSPDALWANRVWISNAHLHIIPRKAPKSAPARLHDMGPATLTHDLALQALLSDAVSTHASFRIQGTLKKKLQQWPKQTEWAAHRLRVCLPLWAASVLVNDAAATTASAKAFIARDLEDMGAVMKDTSLWPHVASGARGREGGGRDNGAAAEGGAKEAAREGPSADELHVCTVRVRLRHFGAMLQQHQTVPKNFQVPQRTDGLGRAVEYGIMLTLGLHMHAANLGLDLSEARASGSTAVAPPDATTLPGWDAWLEGLSNASFFNGNIPGSAEHSMLLNRAKETFLESQPGRHAAQAATRRAEALAQCLHAQADVAAVEASARKPEDDKRYASILVHADVACRVALRLTIHHVPL